MTIYHPPTRTAYTVTTEPELLALLKRLALLERQCA